MFVDPQGKPVKYVVMGADCAPTLRRVILEAKPRGSRLRFKSQNASTQQLLYGYGDGSVTKESLLGIPGRLPGAWNSPYRLPGARAMFFCEAHGGLPKNITYMDNVLHTFLDN